ncbi:MAG: amidase family protein, partial [bacterium]
MELYDQTIPELRELLDQGKISPEELTEACLDRLDEVEDTVKAFERIDRDRVLQRARELEPDKIDSPLAGIPVALKDNLCRDGVEITCSS